MECPNLPLTFVSIFIEDHEATVGLFTSTFGDGTINSTVFELAKNTPLQILGSGATNTLLKSAIAAWIVIDR